MSLNVVVLLLRDWIKMCSVNHTLRFSLYKVFREFQEWIHHYKGQNVDNFSGNAMTTIGKLEGVVGRLSLVFHLIEQPHSSNSLKLERFMSLNVVVLLLRDWIKMCSVNHTLRFSLVAPEVSLNT
jgi:hypothetical protein